ncbi:MAG: flagellar motor switch protein FliM [Planctomycetota bacterium]
MSEILDQSSIDALLAMAEDEEEQPEERQLQIFSRHRKSSDPVDVRQYDFKRPERVSKDQMRALQTLHESFARTFGASLSGFLRTIVEVNVATCEQMTYAEFIAGLPNPTSFNLITADQLEGEICLEISPLIIYPIIDRLLGGTNRDLFIPQRSLTEIEAKLIANVTERSLMSLTEAWQGVIPLQFEITASESNPQLVQIVPPNEVVVVVGLELRMSTRAGTMALCIPFKVIEPVMELLSEQSWFRIRKSDDEQHLTRRLEESVGKATVELRGEIARARITLADLVGLEVGDIIETDTPVASDAVLLVEREQKFRCAVGRHKNRVSVRVKEPIRSASDPVLNDAAEPSDEAA